MKIRPIDEIRRKHSIQPVHMTIRHVQRRLTIDEPMIGTILGNGTQLLDLHIVSGFVSFEDQKITANVDRLVPVENVLSLPLLVRLPGTKMPRCFANDLLLPL